MDMDYETIQAAAFGHALSGLTLNLLVRDIGSEVAFLGGVFAMVTHRVSADFAIIGYENQVFQLHSDAAFAAHPLPSLLPESGPRGGGVEIRLHESDPDEACRRAEDFGGMVLVPPQDKAGHGLREAVILSPHGYAFVPSSRILPPEM